MGEKCQQYRVIPLLVAIIRTGDKSLSRARFRKEKHSMSSIWTSSINKTWNHKQRNLAMYNHRQNKYKHTHTHTHIVELTPGMISALPSSLHSHTLALICSRTSDLISPVSPEKRARKPCVRLLMTSISCRDTVWTTSFLFCSSPSGHCTNCVYKENTQKATTAENLVLLVRVNK